ncbi:MAG TPA: glycosyltransferase [Novosphingobium sp.]|nr:glycosyltransferase [Novosphingobium sp.]
MSPLIVSKSDMAGGAARAAMRLAQALRKSGADAGMLVGEKRSDFSWVQGGRGFKGEAGSTLRAVAGLKLAARQRPTDFNLRSLNVLPSRLGKELRTTRAEVVNLHWIGGEAVSLAQIAAIPRPVVWTLHDMWAFCGAEHYGPDGPDARWRAGYTAANRPQGASGPDLDAATWRRKRKLWTRPRHVICPTPWLARCASESALMRGWSVEAIPNPLDTAVFRPWPKALAREMLGLPAEAPLLGFGAMGGTKDPRKGWDLLEPALVRVAQADPGVQAVIFGQSKPAVEPAIGMPIHWTGHLTDDVVLALLYSALDLVVVPSRQDNLPQTATEAQSCGCPVAAFDACGLGDAVVDGVTGLLAPAFDFEALAKGMAGLLGDRERRERLGRAARDRAVREWDDAVIAPRYLDAYTRAIAAQGQ